MNREEPAHTVRFSPTEERVINRVQEDIPLAGDPFGLIAEELSMPAEEFLSVLEDLKRRRIVRNISAIFNADRLGYYTSLVAFAVPGARVEPAAGIINAHPGVSHNYLRDHRYNLWFTLAADGEAALKRTASVLADRCGADDHLVMKNERLVKIGFMLKVGEDDGGDDEERFPEERATPGPGPDTEFDPSLRRAVLLLQTDLPIVRRPFDTVVENNGGGMSGEELTAIGNELKKRGVMRRYAAVLKHYNAGYRANAMTAWKTGSGPEAEAVIELLRASRHISHLYMRTVHPGKWEHPLFAMIHARSDGALNEIILDLEKRSGIGDYLVLKSLKEYKKKRVTYFSPEFDRWNRENLQ